MSPNLNINKENNFVFIHVPKTGGVSIRKSLFDQDIGPHTTALDQRIYMGKKKYNDFSVIAFVRNPWDRLVSAFFYLKGGGLGNKNDLLLYRTYVQKYGDDFNSFIKNENSKYGHKELSGKFV